MVYDSGHLPARARQLIRAIPSVVEPSSVPRYGQGLGCANDNGWDTSAPSVASTAYPIPSGHMPILCDHVDANRHQYDLQCVHALEHDQHRRYILRVVCVAGVDSCGFVGVSYAATSNGVTVVEVGNLASIASVSLAFLLAIIGGFRYITAQVESIRREITAVEKNAQLFAEKAAETESKQRHNANNAVQVFIAKIESDIRTLQRETVRQEQMDALENRLSNALAKIEIKVDKLAETAAEIVAIRTQLVTVNNRLERISDRLDEQHGIAKNTRA